MLTDFTGADRVYTACGYTDDLHAPQIPPPGGELLIERLGQLQGVAWQGGIADAHVRNLGKGRLEGGQKLCLHLPGNLIGFIVLADVAADVSSPSFPFYRSRTSP